MSKTVVLIHGYGFDVRTWSPVESAFEGFHIIHLSLPGVGDDPVEAPYSIEDLARSYWAEIDSHLAPKVHLVGHSMGGYVCMEMIAQCPDRVLSLTLIHSHVFADNADKKTGRSDAMEFIRTNGCLAQAKKMIPSFFSKTRFPQELVDVLIARGQAYGDDSWYFGMGAMRDRKDHSETLKNVSVPVLLIHGEKDTAVPVELAYTQAAFVTKGSLCVYPDVGHMSMYENTSQLICDILKFYSELT